MPSVELLLHAYPAVGWWVAVWVLGVGVGMLHGGRPGGRWWAGGAAGVLAAATVVPPRGGWVPGVARVCDVGAGHVLMPWQWGQQDPRTGVVLLMLVAGVAVAGRPRWVVALGALPVLVEALHYLVPGLGRACSVPDLLHAWLGLGTGVAVGLAVRGAATLVRRVPSRVVTGGLAALLGLAVVAGVAGQGRAAVDPEARVPLAGEELRATWAAGSGAGAASWLEAGTVPGTGTAYADLGRTALLDLHLLTRAPDGQVRLPPAGPSPRWDYFWPRDGAFVAVALASTGHADDAAALLVEVAGLYLDPGLGPDARYLLTGGRVTTDPRRAQGDGCGWLLWAVHETGRAVGPGSGHPKDLPPEVTGLRDRCTDQLLRSTGGGSHLPTPGPDYWERTTFEHLLGVAAPVAAGLRFAALDYRALGDEERAEVVDRAAAGVRAEIERVFGPSYLRAGGGGGLDAATAMLLPPFDPDPLPGTREAWLAYQEQALRPAGGLAPGTAWKQDGISWTPQVGLVALAAASSGETERAQRWLRWLDRHRAPWGSLPEKVDSAGRPGGPAPLGWTSALVVLTLDALGPDDPTG